MDIHEVGILVDITEHHLATAITDAVGTGSKSHRGDDNLISGLYAQSRSRKVQSGSGIVYGYGKLGAYISGKLRFKFFYFGTLRQVIALQGLDNCPDILVGDMLAAVRNRLCGHFTSKLGSTYFLMFSRMDSTVSQSTLLSLL